jgi:chromatin assembly factor 1 subunit A
LAIAALEQLQKAFPKLSLDCVTEKIKVLATRESYVVSLPGQLTQTKTNVFEDNDITRMWRWEVIILELLPDTVTLQIKKARVARRKLRHHAKAIGKLLASLNVADKLFSDASSTKEKCDAFVTRISNEQEKILKFERETEKTRLLEDAKKKNGESIMVEKNFTQNEKVVENHVVKGSQLDQKRKEKEILDAERLKKKEEMAHLKDEMRLKKQNEREEKEAKAKLEKEQAITKNKTRLLSFFSSGLAETPSTTHLKENSTSLKATSLLTEKERSNFWSLINSSDDDFRTKPLFASLSKSAIQSRTRRTLTVSVDVYVTVMPDDPFSAQPYADLQSIQVPNKYKFLSFEEDHRPAYHGTWSKESSIVTGPTPFGKDTQFLDYDIDSEEEWEEGDDEIGEDLEANDNDDEEENVDPDEGDTRAYNFHDGWLADDDDVIYEDGEADEDAKRLRRAVLKRSENKLEQSELCVICPIYGGLPLSDHKHHLESVEGVIDAGTAFRLEMLNTKEDIEIDEDLCFLDTAFPPELSEEISDLADFSVTPTMTKIVSAPPEMSEEEIKVFARFVHQSKLPSKDQLVEQLRIAHPTITSSRAQATRKLHAIATKHRSPAGVFVWLVKDDVLTELKLVDLLKMKLEEPTSNETKTTKPKTTKGNVVGLDNIVTSIAPPVLDAMDTKQSKTNKAHQLKVLKESIGAIKKRKAPKPQESNRVKRAKVDGQKDEATKCKNASSMASKIIETPSSREIKRKTPSAGSARLFAAFLVGKNPKVANASGNTNS